MALGWAWLLLGAGGGARPLGGLWRGAATRFLVRFDVSGSTNELFHVCGKRGTEWGSELRANQIQD